MKIIIGSNNRAKIKAVKEVFPDDPVTHQHVPSHVSKQPFSDEETREGAINRALQCVESEHEIDNFLGIGLEGGVMYMNDKLFLCNWGALVTKNKKIYTASGARIVLPAMIAQKLQAGIELGEVMAAYTKQQEVRHREGAIGIFTNELVTRKEMFAHVVKLLRGQWEFDQK